MRGNLKNCRQKLIFRRQKIKSSLLQTNHNPSINSGGRNLSSDRRCLQLQKAQYPHKFFIGFSVFDLLFILRFFHIRLTFHLTVFPYPTYFSSYGFSASDLFFILRFFRVRLTFHLTAFPRPTCFSSYDTTLHRPRLTMQTTSYKIKLQSKILTSG